jgi:hypothetical protein
VLTDPQAAQLHQEATAELERHDTGLTPPDDQAPEPADQLVARLSRSHSQHLAHSLDPDLDAVDRLAYTMTLTELEAAHGAAAAAERTATNTHGYHPNQLAAVLARIDHTARHLALGSTVSPTDRHNIGTVTALDDATGQATVEFTSTGGRQATRTFDWAELRLVDPEPRTLPPAAERRLATIHDSVSEQIDAWHHTVRALGVELGDADRYARAIDYHVDRHTHQLAAAHPDWLIRLLGPRPADVAGATTWDDALRDIASWRARHELGHDTPGLGDRPTDPDIAAQWGALQARLADTRVWLAATDRITTLDTIAPSRRELLTRRAELDALFAQAPADWRSTLSELRSGQLTLDDTTDLLRTALDGQQTRRDWIIANWPHVVEYQEINRTLTTATWGPDPDLLTDLLTQPLTPPLAAAIEREDPWLRVALCRLADADTTELDADALDWLQQVALAREEGGIQHEAGLEASWSPPRQSPADIPAVDTGAGSVSDDFGL